MKRAIQIVEASEGKLRSVSCAIPQGEITLLSGPSGAGKTTLALRVVAAEGAYRQFFTEPVTSAEAPPRPKVRTIRNLPVFEALRGAFPKHQSYTLAQVVQLLPLLREHHDQARRWCPQCMIPLRDSSAAAIAQEIVQRGAPVTIVALVRDLPSLRAWSEPRGFSTIWSNGRTLPLEQFREETVSGEVGVVIDRLDASPASLPLITEAVHLARTEGPEGVLISSSAGTELWKRYGICDRCGFQGSSSMEELLMNPRALETLEQELAAVRWWGCSVREILSLQVHVLREKLESSAPSELIGTLTTMDRLRLGHLELSRSVHAISVGEAMRVRLLHSLYHQRKHPLLILDEPLRGLHPTDQTAVLAVVREQADTVLLIDHNPAAHSAATWEIALGPKGGAEGGTLVYEGPPLKKSEPPAVVPPTMLPTSAIRFTEIPTIGTKRVSGELRAGALNVITGISGSGKTSFLFHGLAPRLQRCIEEPSAETSLEAPPSLRRCIIVPYREQSATPCSTVATLSGAFDTLRVWYCKLPLALVRGYRAADLVLGKRSARLTCSTCGGMGVDPLSEQECRTCAGNRFTEPFLEVLWRGASLNDLLTLSINQLLQREGRIPKLHELLERLADAGLGYLSLGQPTTTLSTGEFQRVRIVAELLSSAVPTVFCLDEPTIGLNTEEAAALIAHCRTLTDAGHTLIVIEHNQLLVEASGWVLELGPGAGMDGGEILHQGPPTRTAPLR